MNQYPDNYHGYGRDPSNMQAMGYGGYRDSSAVPPRVQSVPDYSGSSYPMAPHQVAGSMYGQGAPGPYGMAGYGHYNMAGHMGHHHPGMMNPYYNSHAQMAGTGNRHPAYGHTQPGTHMHHHQQQPMGMMGAGQPSHPAMMGGPGSSVPDHYHGGAYPGQSSPSRMPLQHQAHSSHSQVPVPPHPMRQTNAQQNPQEVADNILQMASAYPSNQTVQVPLKNRPAPYHIPRSPHYAPRPEPSHHGSPSPHQQQISPAVSSCQASPSPNSGIKSPVSHNPTPSPSASLLRSPCSNQRPPSNAGPTYTGQGAPQTSLCANTGVEQVQQVGSPHYPHYSMTQAAAYSSPHSHCHTPTAQHRQSSVSSPCSNMMPAHYASSPNHTVPGQTYGPSPAMAASNPLSSLEKLVMLPETQVVDPKSVVNDACLSSQSDEGPKNGEDPAGWPSESLGCSVGCSGRSSSPAVVQAAAGVQSGQETQTGHPSAGPPSAQTTETGVCFHSDLQLQVGQPCASALPAVSTGHSQSHLDSVSHQPVPDICAQPRIGMDHCNEGFNLSQCVSKTDVQVVDSFQTTVSERVESSDVCSQGGETPQSKTVTDQKILISTSAEPCPPHSIKCLKEQETDGAKTESDPNLSGDEPAALHSTVTYDQSSVKVNEASAKVAESGQGIEETDSHLSLEKPSPVLGEATRTSGKQTDYLSSSQGITSGLKSENQPQECSNGCDGKVSSHASQHTAVDFSASKELPKEAIKANVPPLSATPQYAFNLNSKLKEEVIPSPLPCHPPSVLSEVPVISNGIDSGAACRAEGDMELDCDDASRSKVHNGYTALVKSKLSFARRVGQVSHVTPCSIAVGAGERAVCDRFALRRNVSGRITRASSLRNRSDSTGNADSDESLENIATSAFLLAKDPQDGARKRGPGSTKRNGFSKSAGVMVSAASKGAGSYSNGTKTSRDENGCAKYTGAADSDDETCYYEGVDNSYDVYLNTMSGEDSEPSSDEKPVGGQSSHQAQATVSANGSEAPSAKQVPERAEIDMVEVQTTNLTAAKEKAMNGSEVDDPQPSSPPPKKLKESPGTSTTLAYLNQASPEPEKVIDLTCESSSPEVKKACVSPNKQRTGSAEKFRPSILGRRTSVKYPIVVLDKSKIVSPTLFPVKKERSDLINVSEGSTPQQLLCANLPDIKSEKAPCTESGHLATEVVGPQVASDTVKEEADALPQPSILELPKKIQQKRRQKKKKGGKSKGKGKNVQPDRQSDVKDSFKSMKFSRALDMMKSSRKRESGGVGPFVRVVGKRSSPKAVSVFAQPTTELLAAAKQGKSGASGKKGSQPMATTTTFHMVSSLPGMGQPVAPSTRTISQKPWVCAFCGHHSSYKNLGDLFGPYFNENEMDRVEKIALAESRKTDPSKDVKLDSGKRGVPSSNSNKSHQPSASTSVQRKQKRKSALSPRPSAETIPPPEELWVHQACALWAHGVYLVGSKIYGLEEAVKDAAENICSVCKAAGAMIGCLHKGCPMKYHFMCAVEKECYLDEENFSLLCPKHKSKKLGCTSVTKS